MPVNVGTLDRMVRIIGGALLIVLAATGVIGMLGYIGIVPLLTGIFRFCPAYLPFGINSCKAK
ncbi:DUF2892 domain-containing protein [Thiomicrospira sp. ALE5]|uniref:YgaP family membrane protein n=1 Tax=Thiomicrospira sp. ALE5 TaxID=748650 RepID=UPI0008E78B96|nr:DUF2892 domain-containing protein [Thiomicrospira sp. ALE5]SFR56865.1 Protein of unknown function [Thiomicrospira sp. ALE5]